jgi:Leucine-rich repeat (LRR) protein
MRRKLRITKNSLAPLILILSVTGSIFAAIPPSERNALIALYNNTGGNSWYVKDGWKTPPLAPDGFALSGTENTWHGVECNPANTQVIKIDLGGNNLTGSIPSQLGNITHLEELKLYWNNLSGNIPSQLGFLSNLTYLDLGQNSLSGNIPSALGSLSSIEKIHLDSNQLDGSIPIALGSLSQLKGLSLAYNQLTGNIPGELGSLLNLEYIDLSYNQLDGSIPSALGSLSQLWGLYIYSNQLSGNIPSSLGNLTSLEELALANNNLSGNVPTQLGSLGSLWFLDISQNQLDGEIPATFGDLSILRGLYLYDNLLSGSIPLQLGNCTNLRELYLGQNSLSGSLPSNLSNLKSLWILDLNHNQIGGNIPRWLATLPVLGYLDLSHNQLSGNIISTSSHNNTEAFVMAILPQLWYLDLSHNELSGTIPAPLGLLTALQKLYLNSNMLSGVIPTSLMNLVNLTLADFGYNALYTGNASLRTFLDSVNPGWDSTQTIAPWDLSYIYASASSVRVRWTPITYTWDSGGYRLLHSTTSGGPYTYYGMTADKSSTFIDFNLPDPADTYYIVVRTRTEPHGQNQNTVDSIRSTEISTEDRPDIQVKFGSRTFADGGTYNLGTRSRNLVKNPSFNFKIENTGTSLLLLTGTPKVVLTGPDADKFDVIQPPTYMVGEGASVTFVLSASDNWDDLPQGSTETVNLGFLIENNDTDEHPYDYTLIVTVQY